jgi:6-phosphogluconolactonase
MPDSSAREVRDFPSLEALSAAAAAEIVGIAQASVAARGRFTIALAGGRTPRRTYEMLAAVHRDAIDWPRTHVVFGDERLVPPGDPRRNERMAREALLAHVPIPPACVHAVPTDAATPDEVARVYDATLHELLGDHTTDAGGFDPEAPPTVDLALLGVGPDGHTASLFPGSPALEEQSRWVRAVDAPTTVEPAVPRITTTLPFLAGARAVIFLVAGADKGPVLREILGNADHARRFPAALVAPRGRVLWLVELSALLSAIPAPTPNAQP